METSLATKDLVSTSGKKVGAKATRELVSIMNQQKNRNEAAGFIGYIAHVHYAMSMQQPTDAML